MTFLNHSNWIKINKDQSSPSTQIRSSNSLTIIKAFQMSKWLHNFEETYSRWQKMKWNVLQEEYEVKTHLLIAKKLFLHNCTGRHSSVATGSNPKHTIYAFYNLFIEIVMRKDENKQKEAWIGPFFKKRRIKRRIHLWNQFSPLSCVRLTW